MFKNTRMENPSFSNLDTSNVISMKSMFEGANPSNGSLDLSFFNTEKVTDFSFMLREVGWLVSPLEIDISGFDTSSALDMSNMFVYSNSRAISIDEDLWKIKPTTYTDGMLESCYSLVGQNGTTLDYLIENGIWRNDKTYAKIDEEVSSPEPEVYYEEFGLFTTSKTPKAVFLPDAERLGSDATSGTSSNATSTMVLTYGARSWANIEGAEVYEIDNTDFDSQNFAKWQDERGNPKGLAANVKTVRIEASFKHVEFTNPLEEEKIQFNSMSGWFANMTNLTEVDNMQYLPKQIEDYSYVFYNCNWLSNIRYNVEDGQTINIGNVVTPNATSFSHSFDGCMQLSVFLPDFICSQKVENCSYMFANSGFKMIHLQGLGTKNVTNMEGMFSNAVSLQRICVGQDSEWDVSSVTSYNNIFNDCNSLVGEKGTSYELDPQASNLDYARIDGGAENPGYLSSGVAYAKAVVYKNTESNEDTYNMKFYFDNNSHYKDENRVESIPVFKIFDEYKYSERTVDFNGWKDNPELIDKVTLVEFDPSFKDFNKYVFENTAFRKMDYWFMNYHVLENVKGTENIKFDSGWRIGFRYTFANCHKLKNLDFSKTVNYTQPFADYAFLNCYDLEYVDFSNTQFDNFYTCSFLFQDCHSLKTIYVPSSARNRLIWQLSRFAQTEYCCWGTLWRNKRS